MKILNILKGGIFVAIISVVYNFVIFSILKIFPQFSFGFENLTIGPYGFYIVLFLKNFFVGIILAVLFSLAYSNISNDTGEAMYTFRAIFFFVLYSIFALVSFTLGDMLLMQTPEGMLLYLTLDGVIESFIATIPIRIFTVKRDTDLL